MNYPDTPAGAKAYLLKASMLREEDLSFCVPDPSVEGVWKFNLSDIGQKRYLATAAIVYLMGYRDPWGEVRSYGDFELVGG